MTLKNRAQICILKSKNYERAYKYSGHTHGHINKQNNSNDSKRGMRCALRNMPISEIDKVQTSNALIKFN